MTPTKRTVTAELDGIAALAAGLPVTRTEDSITISDATLDRRYLFFVRPGLRGIRITCWVQRGHLIGRDRKYMVRMTLRAGYGAVAGLVRYARYEAERIAAEAAADAATSEPPAANTVTTIDVDAFEAALAALTVPGVTPRIASVEIAPVMEMSVPAYSVTPTWEADGGLDRPNPASWVVANLADCRRLRRALLAGAVYKDATVRRDVGGRTYVNAASTVSGRHLSDDLRRLGF